MTEQELKKRVEQKYTSIALQNRDNSETSCCTPGCCTGETYSMMKDEYTFLEGYEKEADLGLGCGLPTQYARIKKGDHVLDLGSGAGNDCFIARQLTGETGIITGVDFSETMIELAEKNSRKRGYQNVFFRKGDIEDLPVGGNSKDVVISNCVLNLLPSKDKIFHEINRVLKPGGHFCISDIVLNGQLPSELQKETEMFTGCVSGAMQKDEYIIRVFSAGFIDIKIEEEKNIIIPDKILNKYLSKEEILKLKKENLNNISSITVTGTKPITVCGCGTGCC